nr:hypothetical protein [Acidimicrobiia bacterium]
MTRRLLLLLCLSVVAAGCSSDDSPVTSAAQAPPPTTVTTSTTSTIPASTTTTVPQAALDIRAALDGYSAALAAADGPGALAFVDGGTLDLFDDLLLLAASDVHLDDLDYLDAFLVLRLRHRFSGEDLRTMTASDVFLTAVADDLVFPPIDKIEFDAINLIDDEATGEIGGSPAMWFRLEADGWKIALGRTFDEYAQILSLTIEEAALRAAGDAATRSEALLLFVSTLEGEDVDPALIAGPAGG